MGDSTYWTSGDRLNALFRNPKIKIFPPRKGSHSPPSSAEPEQLTCCAVVLHDVNHGLFCDYSITDINIRIIIAFIFWIWSMRAGLIKPVRNGEVFCMNNNIIEVPLYSINNFALFKMILYSQNDELSFDIKIITLTAAN